MNRTALDWELQTPTKPAGESGPLKDSVMYRGEPYRMGTFTGLLHDLRVDGFRIRLDVEPNGACECGLCLLETGAMYLSGEQETPWAAVCAAVRAYNAQQVGL